MPMSVLLGRDASSGKPLHATCVTSPSCILLTPVTVSASERSLHPVMHALMAVPDSRDSPTASLASVAAHERAVTSHRMTLRRCWSTRIATHTLQARALSAYRLCSYSFSSTHSKLPSLYAERQRTHGNREVAGT